jgi:hypothetical protein
MMVRHISAYVKPMKSLNLTGVDVVVRGQGAGGVWQWLEILRSSRAADSHCRSSRPLPTVTSPLAQSVSLRLRLRCIRRLQLFQHSI